MTFDEYEAAVAAFAEASMRDPLTSLMDFVETWRKTDMRAAAAMAFRRSMLTPDEGVLYLGRAQELLLFADPDPDVTSAWYAFMCEVGYAADRKRLRLECAPYQPDQALFRGAPPLLNAIRRRQTSGAPDNELIDDNAVACVGDTNIYRSAPGYAKLSAHLPAGIPVWARQTFPTAPKYLRLDGHFYSPEEPQAYLTEAAIFPADPTWLKQLSLRKGMKTYAQYALMKCSPAQDRVQFYEYGIGLRRIEIRAGRSEERYLSMMIEELPSPDAENGLMIGRCIHLDTDAKAGSSAAEAKVLHLDLAINVYMDATRAKRMINTLQHGKAEDATIRTHLYRIENIPFLTVFDFAGLFFKSSFLLKEWRSAVLV